jgi:outer membrane protein TolC
VLSRLHDVARDLDPRARQIALQETLANLRLENLDASWYPQVELSAEATYQTEVPSLNIDGAGSSVPPPEKDQYTATVEVSQRIYDGGRTRRQRRVERARLEEEKAGVRSSLFDLRESVSRSFFNALLAQEQRAQLGIFARDLRARLDLVRAQAEQGAALSTDTAAIAAELIEVRQDLAEAEARRRASLAVLEALIGQPVSRGTYLAMPNLDADVRSMRATLVASGAMAFEDEIDDPAAREAWTQVIVRPEVTRFERTQDRLQAQADVADAETRPEVSAFAQGVYGRPGLDFLDDSFNPHALVGIRASWSVIDWGQADREAEQLRTEQRVVEADRNALLDRIRRETFRALYDLDRLRDALETDDEAVALREAVEESARRQLEEGVLLASDYVDRRTDVFDARLRQSIHRVELADVQARLLRILGRTLQGDPREPRFEKPIAGPGSTLSTPPPSADPEAIDR